MTKLERKIRNLVFGLVIPAALALILFSMWFVFSSQSRERENWERLVRTSLGLVASSSTVSTYAEYRSFSLAQEAEVYAGFIGDNLSLLAASFDPDGKGDARIRFFDRAGGVAIKATPSGYEIMGLDPGEIPDDGTIDVDRPDPFGPSRYVFRKKLEFSGQHFLLAMEIKDPFRGMLHLTVAIAAVALVFLGGFAAVAARLIGGAVSRIATPVEHLTEVSSKVMAGDLELRAAHESDDEIGELADAFNAMLGRLEGLIEERSRILESVTDGFVAIDPEWNLTYVNAEAERILGHDRKDVVGKKNWDVFPFTLGTDIETTYRSVMSARSPGEIEYFNTFKDQWFNRWISLKAYPVDDGGISVYIKDITERKEAENAVKASLREKEILLHEVHHRVKNNLQIVASLVDLQAMLSDEGDSTLGEAFKNRIRAMGEIYECLSASKDFTGIDFNEYANSLASYLYMSLRSHFGAVSFEVAPGESRLDMNQAFPCGLILNELISNSFRHAFPPSLGRPGRVLVSLTRLEDGMMELAVEDDGIGLPASVTLMSTEGMGLPLIGMLSKQLGGTASLASDRGTRFSIAFGRHAGARTSGISDRLVLRDA